MELNAQVQFMPVMDARGLEEGAAGAAAHEVARRMCGSAHVDSSRADGYRADLADR